MVEHSPGLVAEHVHRFERIEGRLDGVQDKVDTLEQKMERVITKQEQVWRDLRGNGNDEGIVKFVTQLQGQARLIISLALIFGTLFTGGLFLLAWIDLVRK